MSRCSVISTLTVVLAIMLAWSVGCGVGGAPPQTQRKIFRVGYLQSAPFAADGRTTQQPGFEQALRDLGWAPGENIQIEYRTAEGVDDRLPDLVAELVGLRVDVIVATSDSAVLAAKNTTRTIPIVMTDPHDPVGNSLVDSLARPGGNVTGLSRSSPQLAAKQLALFREVAPHVARLAVLWSPLSEAGAAWAETQAAARGSGLPLLSVEVRDFDERIPSIEAAIANGADGLLVLSPASAGHRPIIDLARRTRIPVMSTSPTFVRQGGLVSYGVSISGLRQRSAVYVDKILKGAKPADLPVEQATRFDFAINLTTARDLGLTIRESVMLQVTEVVE